MMFLCVSRLANHSPKEPHTAIHRIFVRPTRSIPAAVIDPTGRAPADALWGGEVPEHSWRPEHSFPPAKRPPPHLEGEHENPIMDDHFFLEGLLPRQGPVNDA